MPAASASAREDRRTLIGARVMFWSAVRCGNRLNDWKTMPISLRIAAMLRMSLVSSMPSTMISPARQLGVFERGGKRNVHSSEGERLPLEVGDVVVGTGETEMVVQFVEHRHELLGDPTRLVDAHHDLSDHPSETPFEDLLHDAPEVGRCFVVILARARHRHPTNEMPLDQPSDGGAVGHRLQCSEWIAGSMGFEHVQLGIRSRVAHLDPRHEPAIVSREINITRHRGKP